MTTKSYADLTVAQTVEGLAGSPAEFAEALTAIAKRHAARQPERDPRAVLQDIAEDSGLTEVHRTEGGVIYRDAGGALINLWLDAPSDRIEEGGLGFDTQVEWFTTAA